MSDALLSLAAAAALVGAPDVPAPLKAPRSAPVRAATGETVLARAPLAAIAAAQEAGTVSRPLGAAPLAVAAAFDAKADMWLKLSQGGKTLVVSEAAARAGASVDLPSGPATLASDDKGLTVRSGGATAVFGQSELLEAMNRAAVKVALGPITYAALTEDGPAVPPAVCLLRRAGEGQFFVTYDSPDALGRAPHWIMATGGLIYGMRVEGRELVFFSKPLPDAAKARAAQRR